MTKNKANGIKSDRSARVILSSCPSISKIQKFLSEYFSSVKIMKSDANSGLSGFYFITFTDGDYLNHLYVAPDWRTLSITDVPSAYQNKPGVLGILECGENSGTIATFLAVRFGGAFRYNGSDYKHTWEIVSDHRTLKTQKGDKDNE